MVYRVYVEKKKALLNTLLADVTDFLTIECVQHGQFMHDTAKEDMLKSCFEKYSLKPEETVLVDLLGRDWYHRNVRPIDVKSVVRSSSRNRSAGDGFIARMPAGRGIFGGGDDIHIPTFVLRYERNRIRLWVVKECSSHSFFPWLHREWKIFFMEVEKWEKN